MSKKDTIKQVMNETPLLNRYLKSRGINPEFATKDQKVAHSKTTQFKKWMIDHMNDTVNEAVDKKDTITFDIPLLIRVLEFAREDLKSDVLLHKMVERLIAIRGKGTLTMNQYGRIVKEEAEALGESYGDRADKLLAYSHSMHQQARKETDPTKKAALSAKGSKAHKVFLKARDRNIAKDPEAHARKMQSGATQDYKDQEAKRGIGHVRDHVEVEGQQLDEISKEKANEYMWSAKSDRQRTDDQINKEVEKQGSGWSKRRHNKIGKLLNRSTKRTTGIDRALDRLNKEEIQTESKKTQPADVFTPGPQANEKYVEKQIAKEKLEKEKKDKKVSEVKEGVVDAVKKAWKAVSNFDNPTPKYDGNTRRRQALKDKLAAKKKPVSEAKEANYGGEYQQSVLNLKAKAEKKPVDMKSLAARMQASYAKDKVKKESLEPMAACNQPGDGANTPDDVAPSKAKKVKLLLGAKKKTVSEEMYDHEKEDKSTAPLGKKVKLQKPGQDSITKEQPQAAAILTGGKTLTGEPRDTIEIDPMMKMRKQSPNSQKSV